MPHILKVSKIQKFKKPKAIAAILSLSALYPEIGEWYLDYIFSLFGGIFLSLIFLSANKIQSRKAFTEKLTYAIALLVNIFIIYEVLLTIQSVTEVGSFLSNPAVPYKLLLGLAVVVQIVVIIGLQILMCRRAILINSQDKMLSKVKKVLIIVCYSLLQGVLVLGAVWTLRNVVFL